MNRTAINRTTTLARLLAIGLFLGGGPAIAQEEEREKPARIALTEPPADDADYRLLGEFVGPIAVAENQYEPLGLQIRPIGGGQFEALQFQGGLPGQEGFNAEALQLIGRRAGDMLVLSGGPWAIFVEPELCTIIDRDGKRIGRLERIGRGSPTMGAKPPAGAVVLFDGQNTDQFMQAQMTEEGWLQAGADVKPMFQDFDMHVEFRLPYMPVSDGQQRGNSGCYLQSRYEVQVLDSFAQLPQFNGCGSLYRMKSPDLNMCYPPLVWQTYDISFTSPRWAADKTKVSHARLTVWHNGVKIQDNFEVTNKTGAGQAEEPVLLPTKFQNHSDPVVFRNIWLIDRGVSPSIAFPVMAEPAGEATDEASNTNSDSSTAAAAAAEATSDETQPEAVSDATQPETSKPN
ncbi:MAG: DUF1080 domain-containing protein [Pirellulaceae bacterium]